jgi:predicted  nucleic acid-binding Zn-ribbon protein
MLNVNFLNLEEEKVCSGCGILIEETSLVSTIIQEEEHLNNIEIFLCEECGDKLHNDMFNGYCRFNS